MAGRQNVGCDRHREVGAAGTENAARGARGRAGAEQSGPVDKKVMNINKMTV